MPHITFATYLHAETGYLSKPADEIEFFGHSWPYFNQVRAALVEALEAYPTLPLRQADDAWYETVHSMTYLQQLRAMAADTPPAEYPKLSMECAGMEYCLPGYRYSLGGMFEALDQMRRGVLDRAYCFSLGGHHGHVDWGHGYCLLNPQAVAVRYAQQLGFARVLIVDWDIHHGDGTQAIFAHDPQVYCISIHSAVDLYMTKMSGIYPGTTTAAIASGHCNIPLLDQRFDDAFVEKLNFSGDFYRAVDSLPVFESALQVLPWRPDLICIFSGYDSHRDDCGRGVTNWTNEDFVRLTEAVLDVSIRSSCPVLSVHGGGYKLPVTVAAAQHHVATLASYA